MLRSLVQYLILPRGVTVFERAYLERMNRIALWFFWLHLPVFMAIGVANGTFVEATVLTAGIVVGPTLGYYALRERPRMFSIVVGVTAMLMGGVLVDIVRGPLQIEMHFYFFVLIALLSVFANPMSVIAAAVTVALHHLVLFLVMPASVFNYDATWFSVVVHAIFVVLESVAACFVARSFFNNVIGLEKVVEKRTAALDARNQDMAMILDNVAQGFVTVTLDGAVGGERSQALAKWFGEPRADSRWWDYVGRNADEAAWIQVCFEGMRDGYMPIEATLAQLPNRVALWDRELAFEYRPIGEPPRSFLAVVTDITDEVARRNVERTQRELVAVLEKATSDRAGFIGFMRESAAMIAKAIEPETDVATLKRCLHTLKGNAPLFGATSISELAHELETEVEEQAEKLTGEQRRRLQTVWLSFEERIEPLEILQDASIIIERSEFDSVIRSIEQPAPAWSQRVEQWGLDPTRPHLDRLGKQAAALARRLDKAEVVLDIRDHQLRVDGQRFQTVWAGLIHAVRNSISHGVETTESRVAAGKSEKATLRLESRVSGSDVVIEIHDDGAGVDWARVSRLAAERGLPHATRADLHETLFSGRLSTADEVTDISGRGVGLDSLRSICRALGGDVQVLSETGQGTTIRCRVGLFSIEQRAA
jgi:HPt (histidine-containing phosphotransfer) domain-containing protein